MGSRLAERGLSALDWLDGLGRVPGRGRAFVAALLGAGAIWAAGLAAVM